MDEYDSTKLIKILFYSDIILNNHDKINNTENGNTNNLPNNELINNNLFTQYYNNNKLSILHDNIQHIKQLYGLDNNDFSNIITYFFLNDVFEIPNNQISIERDQINNLNDKINKMECQIQSKCSLNKNKLNIKLSEHINMPYDIEQLYNPYNNILGHIIYDNDHYIYDEIINYTSEKYLLLNEPILKDNIKTYNVFNNIVLNILNNNLDLTSYNIKKHIDNHKNINYNIDTLLPFYIINHYKSKNIINIGNDYGQWLYASKILNVDKIITINQYKIDDDTIQNINNINDKNVKFKSVDNNYMYDDNNIDLIYYNCNFLHEHTNNNIKNILYNECFYKLKLSWDQLNDNGYLLINLQDAGDKKLIELVNLYINKLYNSEYTGILCVHKNTDIQPIWVFKKKYK